ncbi:Ig-like domain-containing protein [Algicola sagamiensis]|uniref:Ig-like domain-containing protein n=1 Tax=Algicola sagamiensis TaxID=163869 RepID=UPI00035DE726|nr:Ig-like domain-containing protein [Algicola sagamiensis]
MSNNKFISPTTALGIACLCGPLSQNIAFAQNSAITISSQETKIFTTELSFTSEPEAVTSPQGNRVAIWRNVGQLNNITLDMVIEVIGGSPLPTTENLEFATEFDPDKANVDESRVWLHPNSSSVFQEVNLRYSFYESGTYGTGNEKAITIIPTSLFQDIDGNKDNKYEKVTVRKSAVAKTILDKISNIKVDDDGEYLTFSSESSGNTGDQEIAVQIFFQPASSFDISYLAKSKKRRKFDFDGNAKIFFENPIDTSYDDVAPDAPVLNEMNQFKGGEDYPIFTGKAEPLTTVELKISENNGQQMFYSLVDREGNWKIDTKNVSPDSIPFQSIDDSHDDYSVEVVSIDISGNRSAPATGNLNFDNKAPDVSITAIDMNQDNQRSYSVKGKCENGFPLQLFINNVASQSSIQCSSGEWEYTPAMSHLPEGQVNFRVTQADTFNNTGSAEISIKKDTESPTLTVVQNISGDDEFINQSEYGAVSLSGRVDGVADGTKVTVEFIDSQGKHEKVEVPLFDGKWQTPSMDLAALEDGDITLRVTVSDDMNNETVIEHHFKLDKKLPQLAIDSIDVTRDQRPAISGTTDLPAGSVVIVKNTTDHSEICRADVQKNPPLNQWSCVPGSKLPEGDYHFSAEGTDEAKNTQKATFSFRIDIDEDDDGIPDVIEGLTTDSDHDGIPDYQEIDSDNDGIPDAVEAGEKPTEPVDTDGDLIPDYQDSDSDGDGIPDSVEAGKEPTTPVDTDGDLTPDYQDKDSDGDRIPDSVEAGNEPTTPMDTDGDLTPDYQDKDSDGDGIHDKDELDDKGQPIDTDDDGKPDHRDTDSDGDGIDDEDELGKDGKPVDTDNDSTPDHRDIDSDGDGIDDEDELGQDGQPINTDGDERPNHLDTDSDNDGFPDSEEGTGDIDGDNIPNYLDDDSDNDGLDDRYEIGDGSEPKDTDQDGQPDYLDKDSDNDGLDDRTESENAHSPFDTDGDNIPDHLDKDSDNDRIPDAIEIKEGSAIDTDDDGKPDHLDIDSDGDLIPDLIESGLHGQDDDHDGIVNALDVDFTKGEDTNKDGIDDHYSALDTERDNTPDYLDRDSDNDGILDKDEVLAELNIDHDLDGIGAAYDTDDRDEQNTTIKVGDVANDSDGDGVMNFRDLDSDNDSIPDVIEAGLDDKDEDGFSDGETATLPLKDEDNDDLPDFLDVKDDEVLDILETDYADKDKNNDGRIDDIKDSDGDGIPDVSDTDKSVYGLNADNDGDSIPNSLDKDDDNDGIPDTIEAPNGKDIDTDNDGIPDRIDLDSDNDGIPDSIEGIGNDSFDTDGDGRIDTPADSDKDGLVDTVPEDMTPVDSDEDGQPDFRDDDSDNDGISDLEETRPNNGGEKDDGRTIDSDNDGLNDSFDPDNGGKPPVLNDSDNDGTFNYQDKDSDGDGISDDIENGDFNGDGVPDYQQNDKGLETAVSGSGTFGSILLGILATLGLRRRQTKK